jgi:hypothetical protein
MRHIVDRSFEGRPRSGFWSLSSGVAYLAALVLIGYLTVPAVVSAQVTPPQYGSGPGATGVGGLTTPNGVQAEDSGETASVVVRALPRTGEGLNGVPEPAIPPLLSLSAVVLLALACCWVAYRTIERRNHEPGRPGERPVRNGRHS